MAAFSRGFCSSAPLHHLSPRLAPHITRPSQFQLIFHRTRTTTPLTHSRPLTTSPPHLAPTKRHPPKPKPLPKRTPPQQQKASLNPSTPSLTPTPPPIHQTYATTLALRPSRTLLYRGPSHRLYTLGSYVFGGFCFAYAGWNFYAQTLDPPEGLAPWIPWAFAGVCVGMAGLGVWLVRGPSRLIHMIEAIPLKSSLPSSSSSSSKTSPTPKLNLQITLHRPIPIPFLKRRTFQIPPSHLTLSAPLTPPTPTTLSPTQYLAHRRAVEAAERARRDLDRSRLLTAPFRHASYFAWRGVKVLGRVWTKEGFVRCTINGRRGAWKVDREGAWCKDGGRGVDRLVNVRAGGGG
ncbi:MAG: hypothetical protein M1817_001515 [Caeruleum heppii]|nr:MAG: hypothetical protein M1817_001515 [Caeruleum heppii]